MPHRRGMDLSTRFARLIAWLRGAHDALRASPWLIVAMLLLALVAWINRDYVAFLAWGVCKIALGAYLGYWIDRSLFPYERPHALEGIARGTATKRRAAILAACVLALGLAP